MGDTVDDEVAEPDADCTKGAVPAFRAIEEGGGKDGRSFEAVRI